MGEIRITVPERKIAEFCKRWDVIELALFGSVLSADFDSNSDIDVPVTFSDNAERTLFDLIRMEGELKEIFDDASTTFGCIIDEESTPFRVTVYGERLEGVEMPKVQYYTREEQGHLYNKEIYEWRDDRFVKI